MLRMPSDAKKRQLQKKKDAAKARQNIKPAGSKTDSNGVSNGEENVPISEEGNNIFNIIKLFLIMIWFIFNYCWAVPLQYCL